MTIALAVIFIIIALIHLYTCFFKIETLRKLTKPMLLALLAAIYCSYTLPANNFHWQVLAALILGMIGDTFLLSTKKTMFLCGAFSFTFGHCFYFYSLLTFTPLNGYKPSPLVIILIILSVVLCLVALCKMMFSHLSKDLKPMFPVYIGLVFVLFSLSLLTFIASITSVPGSVLPAACLMVGSLSFLISDNKLAYDKFKKATPYGNFYIMLTYIIAQSLLTAGFIMI